MALTDFTAEPWCYGNHKLSPRLSITGFIGPNQVEEDSSNASWEMEGGAALQATAPQRLCGINTLANTMKHCINVSNYRLEERAGGGGRVQKWGGRNKDVPLAVNHSNRYGRKGGQSELLQWDEACPETLCAEMLRAKSQRRWGQRFNRYICNSKASKFPSSVLYSEQLCQCHTSEKKLKGSTTIIFPNDARVSVLLYLEKMIFIYF